MQTESGHDTTNDSEPRFLASEFAPRRAADCRFQVVPVPLERTVSFGAGTARGPAAVIRASDQLEVWDGESCPGDEGIATWPAVNCFGPLAGVHEEIYAEVRAAHSISDRAIPVILGGEHSLSFPAFRAVRDATPSALGLVQIDAHADLRDTYDGTELSHACVARRIHSDLGSPIVQYGVRSLSHEESLYQSAHCDTIVCHSARTLMTAAHSQRATALPSFLPECVYLTIDVDGLDAAIMPATGTPVPGGLDWYTALHLIENVAARRTIVAVDIVELAPIDGFHAWDYTVAELAYRVMGIIARAAAVR